MPPPKLHNSYLGGSQTLEVALARFKPPPGQKDASAVYRARRRSEVYPASQPPPRQAAPAPARPESHCRGCGCGPLTGSGGGHGSPLPTPSLLPQIQRHTDLSSKPQSPPGRVSGPHLGRLPLPSVPQPTAEKLRAAGSSLKSSTNQSQRNLFLPRGPSTLRRMRSRAAEGRGQI